MRKGEGGGCTVEEIAEAEKHHCGAKVVGRWGRDGGNGLCTLMVCLVVANGNGNGKGGVL